MAASLILLLGSPRSGTTWLGKIFDSHPDVFYLHEPDSIVRNADLPFFAEDENRECVINKSEMYLKKLQNVRHPKVTTSMPIFAKSFRTAHQERMRQLLVYGAKAAAAAADRLGLAFSPTVPDLFAAGREPSATVLKSVSSLGRAKLFVDAVPNLRIVHLARHPCSQIASRLHGSSLGLLRAKTFVSTLARTRYAARLGLDETAMKALSLEGQMACQWTIANAMVHDALARHPNYHFVLYEDLCRDAEATARGLLHRCGLPQSPQTEAFLRRSTAGGQERYFGVVRDSRAEIGKWRRRLDGEQIAAITAVVERTPFGRMVLERAG
jgi:hypothetical protein